jgi:hypothetical protein
MAIAAVLKTAVPKGTSGFESQALRWKRLMCCFLRQHSGTLYMQPLRCMGATAVRRHSMPIWAKTPVRSSRGDGLFDHGPESVTPDYHVRLGTHLTGLDSASLRSWVSMANGGL